MPAERYQGLPPVREAGRFEWLREPRGRRSALMDVEKAVRRGWDIDEEGRGDLVKELNALLESGGLSGRERFRVARIFMAMDASNAMEEAAGPR